MLTKTNSHKPRYNNKLTESQTTTHTTLITECMTAHTNTQQLNIPRPLFRCNTEPHRQLNTISIQLQTNCKSSTLLQRRLLQNKVIYKLNELSFTYSELVQV